MSQALQTLARKTIKNPNHQLLLAKNHSQPKMATPTKVLYMLASTLASPP